MSGGLYAAAQGGPTREREVFVRCLLAGSRSVPHRPEEFGSEVGTVEKVKIGPFNVGDLSYEGVVDAAVQLALDTNLGPKRAYALHVGGLNHRRDRAFIDEMNSGDLVYADGGSAVLLGRIAGARSIQRAPTTDIGWDILRRLSAQLRRSARIAMIGGPQGLALRAAGALEAGHAGVVVFTAHGYQADWAAVVEEMRGIEIDVLLVGLGAPEEMLWVGRWLDKLPPALVVTCGGWFGFLAGDEHRAAPLFRRAGLEWIGRVAQSPHRLGGRYAKGAWTTAVVGLQVLARRQSFPGGKPDLQSSESASP